MTKTDKTEKFSAAWTAFVQGVDADYKDKNPRAWAAWKDKQWVAMLDQLEMTGDDIAALLKHIRA
jgi:hypothetical protein